MCSKKLDGRGGGVQYESDSQLREIEQIPLLEEGGIESFLQREVLPYAPDAWYVPEIVRIGYEISFTLHFYKLLPLRSLEAIRADILAVETDVKGLLSKVLAGGASWAE